MNTTTPPRPPDAASTGPVPSLLRIRLGMALQKQRMQRGLTQAELAENANLSLKYVGEIERGEANTTLGVIERLSVVLKWDPMEAFTALREPLSEGVRVMLIELLKGFITGLQEAIRWLQALDPALNMPRFSRRDVVDDAPSTAEHGNSGKPKFMRRLLGRKS